ncbi:Glycosyltransferase involved in cell wall bisynthesis [Xylanibacter ruminicola]|uniref:Glycosyltransferase involved in cell wall bisynthesis n=1 Tax=Xylanibacter ruminicola TaxID=839 RepID=A0A1H5UC43_XYLRU|nr:glycosyltransferase family 2 protein [Xylanibacter ruminicola]SEF71988.1 Glycosyltransferase involved in cell wall bisynthesis [Xylanibacter ruminicola]
MINNLYIVMPAYNEAENIETTIKEWYPVVERLNSNDCKCHLVIANDGSKDNTYHKMLGLQESYPMLIPLDKPNSGHGATVLYLYRYAIEQGADFVFQTDSDGQTNPNEIWQMIEHAEDYDFQIGNRNNRQDGMSRVFVTKVLKMVVWLMFHVWVTDANTPFRLMNVERLKRIMAVIPEDYFLCNVAISAIAVKWHERCKWYPITFKPRQGGVNSINMKRIVKIGRKALNDFYTINKNLRHVG